jgi:hypothetical protein
MSTISTVAGTNFSVGWNFSISFSLASGTEITPILDLLLEKAKLLVSAFVFDMQLKTVVLPQLAMPMIPQCKPIFIQNLSGANLIIFIGVIKQMRHLPHLYIC